MRKGKTKTFRESKKLPGVPRQGRLAHEASRPLIAEDLHPASLEGAVLINVERSGEFVAAWRKVDAGNSSADVQLALLETTLSTANHYLIAFATREPFPVIRIRQTIDLLFSLNGKSLRPCRMIRCFDYVIGRS